MLSDRSTGLPEKLKAVRALRIQVVPRVQGAASRQWPAVAACFFWLRCIGQVLDQGLIVIPERVLGLSLVSSMLLGPCVADAREAQKGPLAGARIFLKAVEQRAYGRAYDQLSQAARQGLDVAEFAERASQLRGFRTQELRITDQASHLCHLRVRARVKLEVHHKTVLATYAGTVTLVRSRQGWLIDAVEMRPQSQRYVQADFCL